jgi:hypothetical protein
MGDGDKGRGRRNKKEEKNKKEKIKENEKIRGKKEGNKKGRVLWTFRSSHRRSRFAKCFLKTILASSQNPLHQHSHSRSSTKRTLT